jgi:prepilin-type N-terminal cleavage/methylation domain-containing protein
VEKIMTKGKYTKGFTLVELLVVIAIIAILAGALFIVINPAKLTAKARDSQRISALTELNKAIAASVADQKFTVTASTAQTLSRGSTRLVDGTGWVKGTAGSTLSGFLATLPIDPTETATSNPGTFYFASDASGNWELDTVLENSDNFTLMQSDGGNSGAVATACNGTSTTLSTNCRYEIGPVVSLM